MDATSYIVELMDIGSRYFEPPDDADEAEEEFEELENEPALEDWRAI
jgi:hypothetical protein